MASRYTSFICLSHGWFVMELNVFVNILSRTFEKDSLEHDVWYHWNFILFYFQIFGPGKKLGSLIMLTISLLIIASSISLQLFCNIPDFEKFSTFPHVRKILHYYKIGKGYQILYRTLYYSKIFDSTLL